MTDRYFDILKKVFNDAGFRLYIVGGTTRDLLLGRAYEDRDFVTDATPIDMRAFIPQADYTFERYGAVRLRVEGKSIDITTLRQESGYKDHRHPGKVIFVKDTAIDYERRDFTINAMYLDEEYRLIDYCSGEEDLKKGLIRFIGDPNVRIEEDPLRILRAKRFALSLGFEIEEKTREAMDNKLGLLKKLNPEKIKEEERKSGRELIEHD